MSSAELRGGGSCENAISLALQRIISLAYVNYFDILAESFSAKIESGAIGTPVALRLYLQLTADHGLLLPYAALGVDLAQRWLTGQADVAHAQGGVEKGYITVLGRLGTGTCLVHSELIRGSDSPSVRLVIVGNRGSAEFSDSPSALGRVDELTPASLQPLVERIEDKL